MGRNTGILTPSKILIFHSRKVAFVAVTGCLLMGKGFWAKGLPTVCIVGSRVAISAILELSCSIATPIMRVDRLEREVVSGRRFTIEKAGNGESLQHWKSLWQRAFEKPVWIQLWPPRIMGSTSSSTRRVCVCSPNSSKRLEHTYLWRYQVE